MVILLINSPEIKIIDMSGLEILLAIELAYIAYTILID
jgi:hypothetical protein